MTKAQIKAELRRSACEDEDPWCGVKWGALDFATKSLCKGEGILLAHPDTLRNFFLLVAEAL